MPPYTPETACRVLGGLHGRHASVTSRRKRGTRRHDCTRLPAALSDELGGLSTSLGLSASPLLILWTESVVVMEWNGMSTAIATQYVPIRGKMPGASAKSALLGPMSSD